jgi:hypothetical protein
MIAFTRSAAASVSVKTFGLALAIDHPSNLAMAGLDPAIQQKPQATAFFPGWPHQVRP